MISTEPLILFALPWLIYRITVLVYKKQFSIKVELTKGLFYFSIVFIYTMTLFPFPFYVYPHEMGDPFQLMNLIPFSSIYGSLTHFYYMVPIRNIGGNILLFIPLGLAIPLRFKINKLRHVILIGLFISLIVEVVQLFTAMRSFDVDDLILNTLGATLGFVIYLVFIKMTRSKRFEEVAVVNE